MSLSAATAVGLIATGLFALPASGSVTATTAPTSSYAVIGTITTPGFVDALATDADDDTVYVTDRTNNALLSIPPAMTSGATNLSLPLPARPDYIAVDHDDDTVYVSSEFSSRRIWATDAGQSISSTIPLPLRATGLAVDTDDDTLYASVGFHVGDDSFFVINGSNYDDSTILAGTGYNNYGMGVNDVTDTVWIAGFSSDSVRTLNGSTLALSTIAGTYILPRDLGANPVVNEAYVSTTIGSAPGVQKVGPSGSLATWTDPAAQSMILGVSVNPAGTRVVFFSGNNNDALWVLDTATMQPDGPPITIPSMNDTVQTASGLIYVTTYSAKAMHTVAKLQGSLNAATAQPGDTLTISIAPTPSVVAGQPIVVDDSTISSIDFGGVSAPVTRVAPNTFEVTMPAVPVGPVPAVATLAGGGTLALGTVTVGSPAPVEPMPATAPGDVVATAEDGTVSLSWSAPESAGSFPMTHYQVTSHPTGGSCLVPSSQTSCQVAGLDNGTAYTLQVRALSGAGWGAWSQESNTVTPSPNNDPQIVITGSRSGRTITVTGSTTELGMGAILHPWVRLPGRSSFVQGSARILVTNEGTFSWSRRAGRAITVYLSTADGMRSNTITISRT